MLLQQFRHGEDRADTHLFGRATGNGNTEVAPQGLQSASHGYTLVHYHSR